MLKFKNKECIKVETYGEMKVVTSRLQKLGADFDIEGFPPMKNMNTLFIYPASNKVRIYLVDGGSFITYEKFLEL